MGVLLFIVSLAILAVVFYCAFKESSTTSLYAAFGVYNRFKAYLFVDLVCAGAVTVLFGPFMIIGAGETMAGLGMIAVGIICMLIGMWIYMRALDRCPDGLRKNLFKSMMISGWGVAAKIAVFFLAFVWAIMKPEEMVDNDGNKVFIIGDDVFDAGGNRIGKRIEYNKYIKTS